jgi:hypothetical protein
VLYCIRGRIVFHTGSVMPIADTGDRLVLPSHTPHAATIGPEGSAALKPPAKGRSGLDQPGAVPCKSVPAATVMDRTASTVATRTAPCTRSDECGWTTRSRGQRR